MTKIVNKRTDNNTVEENKTATPIKLRRNICEKHNITEEELQKEIDILSTNIKFSTNIMAMIALVELMLSGDIAAPN